MSLLLATLTLSTAAYYYYHQRQSKALYIIEVSIHMSRAEFQAHLLSFDTSNLPLFHNVKIVSKLHNQYVNSYVISANPEIVDKLQQSPLIMNIRPYLASSRRV